MLLLLLLLLFTFLADSTTETVHTFARLGSHSGLTEHSFLVACDAVSVE